MYLGNRRTNTSITHFMDDNEYRNAIIRHELNFSSNVQSLIKQTMLSTLRVSMSSNIIRNNINEIPTNRTSEFAAKTVL